MAVAGTVACLIEAHPSAVAASNASVEVMIDGDQGSTVRSGRDVAGQ